MLMNLLQLNRAAILLEDADSALVGVECVPAHLPRDSVLVRVDGECFLIDRDGRSVLVDAQVLAGFAPVGAVS